MNYLQPVFEKFYPDEGGFTGFSIFIWEVPVEHKWGADRFFILEGRYFTNGKLYEHKLEVSDRQAVLESAAQKIENVWTPMMDRYLQNH